MSKVSTERQREFLLKLADLCDEYKVEITYTNDDDGIHILTNGEKVFVGFINASGAPLRQAASQN